MILALVRQGKKVGATSTSHKVIHNLLAEVLRQAVPGDGLSVAAKVGDDFDEAGGKGVLALKGNDAPLAAFEDGEANVMGGTAWHWAREEYASSVDVLFVDEAGQMSLANVLAVSQAANSVVLLGDPQQLDQPEKASHPDGVGCVGPGPRAGRPRDDAASAGTTAGSRWARSTSSRARRAPQ